MKTKTKKLLSIILSIVMLFGALSFGSVSAADKEVIDGLYVDYNGETTVAYSTAIAYSGSRSVCIDAKSGTHAWIGDPEGDFGMDPAKAYGLEFYLYVDSWTSGAIQLKPTDNKNNTYPTVYYATIENGGAGLYLNGTNKDRWGIERITEGEKAGWYRVWNKTAIIAEDGKFNTVDGYGKGYMWYTDGEMKVYLDNINVYEWSGYTTSQNSGTRGENPVFVQDFEAEVIPEVTLPDAEDLDTENVNLTLASGTGYTNSGAIYGITDFAAHTGEKSLYVDSTAGKIGLGSCEDDFGMVKGTAYGMKFSIYIVENSSGMLQIRPQNSQNQTYRAMYYTEISGNSKDGLSVTGACKDRWSVTAGTGDKTGWYTFESTYPVYVENTDIADFMPGLMFNFEGKFKAFIDDIEFYNWTKAPATGDGFANGMGTELFASRDFEDVVIPMPELPNAQDLDTKNVGLTLASGEGYTNSGAVYGITDATAYTGEKSLYVDSTAGKIGLGSCADDFGMVKGTAYGMKFSIFVAENSNGKLQIKPQNNGNDVYSSVYYTEISGTSADELVVEGKCANRWTITKGTDDKLGWYTFESIYPVYVETTDKAQFAPGLMFNFEGQFKAFIDDIEFYNWTKAPATGDGFANGMGTELFASRDFEDVVIPMPELPNAQDLDTKNVGLTLASGEGYTNSGAVYGITDATAYTGEKSLYVDSTAGKIGLGSGEDDFGLVKGTAYGMKFSIFVAENSNGKLQIRPQNSENQTYKSMYYTEISGTSADELVVEGKCANRWTITKGTDDKLGWYTFESIYPVYVETTDKAQFAPGLMFNFEGQFKAFIDDIEFYNWTKEPVEGDGFANGMGTELFASRDFEGVLNIVPEIPNAEDLDTKNVGLTLASGAGYTNSGAIYGVTDAAARTGEKSLYVDSTAGKIGLGSCEDDFGMVKGTAYGMKFSIYVVENSSGMLQIRPQNSQNQTYSSVYYTEITGTSENGLVVGGKCKDRWKITAGTGYKTGWYTFESTYPVYVENTDIADFMPGLMFNFEGKFKAFIDDIEFYNWTKAPAAGDAFANGMGTELFASRDFEGVLNVGPEIPNTEDLDTKNVGLTLASGEGYDESGAVYGITDFAAYTGEKSLYVDSTAGKIGLGSCADDFGMVKGTPYGMKFSIYVVENSSGMLQIRPQNNQNQTYSSVYYTEITGTSENGLVVGGKCKDRWTITAGTGDKTGWYTFESTYPVYVENTDIAAFMPGLMFNFEGKFKAFIDDIEFYNWTKEPATGEGFANGMGTELVGYRDFEDVVIVAPELPNAEDLDTDNMKLTLNPDYAGTKGVYGITDTYGFKGTNSLYVDSTEGSVGLGSADTDFGMEKGTAYGLKFSIYVVENAEGVLEIKPQNSSNQTYKGNHYIEISGTSDAGLTVGGYCADRWKVTPAGGAKKGWYTFETRFPVLVEPDNDSAGFLAGQMFNFKGKFKAFIDEVEVYNWDKALATGDAMKDGMGTTLLASRTFEFSGDYIGKFIKAVSGNNVTVSVEIRNCTKDNYTAQLILGVYTGNTLDLAVMTDVTPVAKVEELGETTVLTRTITVPEGKDLKIVLWDSLTGMRPIKRNEIYTMGE